jgi:hypothetical protein
MSTLLDVRKSQTDIALILTDLAFSETSGNVVLEQTSNDFGTFNRLDVLQLFWFLTDAHGRTKDLIEFTTAGMFLLVTICTTFVWLTLVI